MTQHSNSLYLLRMFESAQKALIFLQDKTRTNCDQDEIIRLALLHLIQTVGEAARNISESYQNQHPEIAWKPIMGIRHRIVHNYADIADEVICNGDRRYTMLSLVTDVTHLRFICHLDKGFKPLVRVLHLRKVS